MVLKFPNSMDECLYFSRRTIGEKGRVTAWVFKMQCPKCKKGVMGKPKDEKTGRPKIRATEYVCDSCGYSEEKAAHQEKLVMNVQYTCPFCGNEGEATTAYKLKSFDGMKAYVFECAKCHKKIGITKKMKEKGSKDEPDDDDE
ncbi:hypothetical protein JXB27_03690 [Candidatus Woesearchaeota archaeon]|nr:hypothetical protein [Candidatus Woesearchaeota archaeon]